MNIEQRIKKKLYLSLKKLFLLDKDAFKQIIENKNELTKNILGIKNVAIKNIDLYLSLKYFCNLIFNLLNL